MRVAREGLPFIVVPGMAALALAATGHRWAAAPFALASLASLGFFRDPERRVPEVEDAVLAPADGSVVGIVRTRDAFVGDAVRLSIFLSPLDVHVNRAPVAGVVVAKTYTPGRFLAAYRAEASEVNERCVLHIQGDSGRVTVVQVAGVVARRIVCRVDAGDKLAAGERFGLIRFGSRTDLLVPHGTAIRVRERERVRGGETVIGVLG